MSLFPSLPWERMRELATRAIIAWEPPKSGLPKLQEECAEVIAAVNQYSYGRASATDLAQELADNLLMLVQAAILLGDGVMREAIKFKLQRLDERLCFERSSGCPICHGKGETEDGARCPNCYPRELSSTQHEANCLLKRGILGCSCRELLKHRLLQMRSDIAVVKDALEPPTDEWLDQVFRDFAPLTPVKEWRRRVYERCVAHHALKVEVLRG